MSHRSMKFFRFKQLLSPRFFLRLGPLVVMCWPRERWFRRIEVRWDGIE